MPKLKSDDLYSLNNKKLTSDFSFRRAILSALNWLTKNQYLQKDGYPNLYSKEEVYTT